MGESFFLPVELAIAMGMADAGKARLGKARAAEIRRTGFAEKLQNEGEVWRGSAAVTEAGRCVGCLVIAAPAFRVGATKRRSCRRLLLRHAEELSVELEGVGAGAAVTAARRKGGGGA
jgi:hypothetical protein